MTTQGTNTQPLSIQRMHGPISERYAEGNPLHTVAVLTEYHRREVARLRDRAGNTNNPGDHATLTSARYVLKGVEACALALGIITEPTVR